MADDQQLAVSPVSAADARAMAPQLAALLHACVKAGANIGFIMPFSADDAARFWHGTVVPALEAGGRVMWVARTGDRLAGTVQLDHAMPANQTHRAEVTKLMVHPDCRRRGVARALMAELEDEARHLGRSLITFDTLTGSAAEPLYTSLGYETAGIIPDYCRDPHEDRLYPTTYMYKVL